MKKTTLLNFLLLWGGVLALLLTPACSDDYDDSGLRQDMQDLADRIQKLEEQAQTTNADLQTLHRLIEALQEQVYVIKVEQHDDTYTIYFTDGTTAVIKTGNDGAAGKDAPVIGVKADSDGVYYWTITADGQTEWLTDAQGNKLRAESVEPLLGVDKEGYWTVSYDGGKTYSQILGPDGKPVAAMSSILDNIEVEDDTLIITLGDGSTVEVPIRSNFYLLIKDAPEKAAFAFGETKTFDLERVGVERTAITKPDEWKVSLTDDKLTVTAPTQEHEACADLEGEIAIIYTGANNLSGIVSLAVGIEEPKTIEIVVTGQGIGYGDYEGETATIDATITPSDNEMLYYVGEYRPDFMEDPDDMATVLDMQLQALNFMLSFQDWEAATKGLCYRGVQNYTAKFLKEDHDYYIVAFGIKPDEKDGQTVAVATTQVFRSEKVHTMKVAAADNAIDLSAEGTSNSYIVGQPNTVYKFKATVMGNGKATTGITPEAVDPKKAIILWETGTEKNAIIKEVELTDDGYVKFTTGEKIDGNAVIAVTDGIPVDNADQKLPEGTILWSWHIWATDYTVDKDKKVVAVSQKEYMMMDVNLGEWSEKSLGYSSGYWGLKYQWGRKDPFVSFTYSGIPAGACISHYKEYGVDADYSPYFDTDAESINCTVAYPHIFIKGGYGTSQDWYGTSTGIEHRNNNLWGNAEGSTGVKTIYDPCPLGYKVMPFEAVSGFYNATDGLTIYPADMHVSGAFAQGWNFITEGENYTFFPAAGSITGSTGSARGFGTTGYYFTSNPILGTTSTTATQVQGVRLESSYIMLSSMNRSDGASIRCVRE